MLYRDQILNKKIFAKIINYFSIFIYVFKTAEIIAISNYFGGMEMGKYYVSDQITRDVIRKLKSRENYLIGSEMGSGKNYWVREVLLPYALDNNMRTLVLSHRKNNLEQQKNELEDYKQQCIAQFKGGMFDTITYQAFQNMIIRNDSKINSYDFIICDEAHYFVSDSSFNTKTELAFNFLNENEKAIKIFMTATSDGLIYLPWKSELKSLNEANYYNHNVNNIYRYEQDETIASKVKDEVDQKHKVLIYHNSLETMGDFKIGDSRVLHSGNRESSDEYNQLIMKKSFDCDVLNSTKLITEGTEIKDDNVKTIVLHGISDIDTFVQATARVRNQKINVYYKRISLRSIQAKLRYLNKQLEYYDTYMELGETEFVRLHGLDVISKNMKAFYLDVIIDPISNQSYTHLKVHQTGKAYLEYQCDMYEFMFLNGFEMFFERYFPEIQFYDLEQLKREEFIKLDIINNYLNKKIFKSHQLELIDMICKKFGLRAKNGSTNIGMRTINSFFIDNHINFSIISKQEKDKTSKHFNKTYWMLIQI